MQNPRFFFLMTVLMVISGVNVSVAAPWDRDDHFAVGYAVYGGGFQALDIDVSMDFAATKYKAKMQAKPYGVLGKLLPWAGDYKSAGMMKGVTLTPEYHDRVSAWRDDQDHMRMEYKDGVLVSLKKTSKVKGKDVAEKTWLVKSYHENTVDLVTSIMSMLAHASDTGNCDFKQDVFDGKRRFRMTFKDKGVTELKKSGLNIYGGKAVVCQMELIPLKGFAGKKPRGFYKIQEESRAKGELPTVWIAQAWEGGPYIPVRMMVKSEYGVVLVHLQNITR